MSASKNENVSDSEQEITQKRSDHEGRQIYSEEMVNLNENISTASDHKMQMNKASNESKHEMYSEKRKTLNENKISIFEMKESIGSKQKEECVRKWERNNNPGLQSNNFEKSQRKDKLNPEEISETVKRYYKKPKILCESTVSEQPSVFKFNVKNVEVQNRPEKIKELNSNVPLTHKKSGWVQ